LKDELQRRGLLPGDATVFTHQLEVLLRVAGGLDRLRQNEPLWRLFKLVNRWLPAWRYTANLSNRDDAEDFLEAVEKVSHWIEHDLNRGALMAARIGWLPVNRAREVFLRRERKSKRMSKSIQIPAACVKPNPHDALPLDVVGVIIEPDSTDLNHPPNLDHGVSGVAVLDGLFEDLNNGRPTAAA
jgi:hypothetical protein